MCHVFCKRCFLILAFSLALGGCQSFIQARYMPHDGIRPEQYAVDVERDQVMTASDGVKLVADVYRPRTNERVPTILVRIPFTSTFFNRLRADGVAYFWASRGYNVVIQGSRGRYKSGGDYYPLKNERNDGVETLKWLAAQPWFDGRLGMWGSSAFGYTEWVLADQSDPGPRALDVQIASTDFHGMFYPGGAFSLESALFWAARSHGKEDVDPDLNDLEKGYAGFPLIKADDRAVGDVPFFDDWVRHPEKDGYWQSIDGVDRARTSRAPVLLMAGWYDPFLPTELADYAALKESANPRVAHETRLVIGPWSQADTVTPPGGYYPGDYRKAVLAPSIAWFDAELSGKSKNTFAPVRIYVQGDNVWRDEQEWPLARARPTPFYLSSAGDAGGTSHAGRLVAAPPWGSQPADSYTYDPRNPTPSRGGAMLGPRAGIMQQNTVEARKDVLVYTSDRLPADLEVTGPVSAVLYVATTATNTDFTAKLVDVWPDGKAFNVTDGIRRREYKRSGAPRAEISIDLWPTSMVFKKGHSIRLEVSSSDYPRFDRNPNTGGDIATETMPMKAVQTVFHGKDMLSRIILPIVPR